MDRITRRLPIVYIKRAIITMMMFIAVVFLVEHLAASLEMRKTEVKKREYYPRHKMKQVKRSPGLGDTEDYSRLIQEDAKMVPAPQVDVQQVKHLHTTTRTPSHLNSVDNDAANNNLEPDYLDNDKGSTNSKEENPQPSNTIVITMASKKYLDITENMLRSIATLHIGPNITIIAADEETYTHFSSNPSVHVVPPQQIQTVQDMSWTNGTRSFVYTRYSYILDALCHNQDVLMADVDTVWLENPFPYLAQVNSDVVLQWNPEDHLCPGLAYYRSTKNTIQFLRKLIKKLKTRERDTVLINMLLNENVVPQLRYEIFEIRKFVSGLYYFDDDWRADNPDVRPIIVHADGINTFSRDTAYWHDLKVQFLKKYGLWFFRD